MDCSRLGESLDSRTLGVSALNSEQTAPRINLYLLLLVFSSEICTFLLGSKGLKWFSNLHSIQVLRININRDFVNAIIIDNSNFLFM